MILLALLACDAGSGDTADCETICGDLDGSGGDTGNIPNLIGSWNATWAAQEYKDDCDLDYFNQGSESWLGSAFQVNGRVPDQIFVQFEGGTEPFRGLIAPTGGVSFAGDYDHREGLIRVAFGGMVYEDTYRDRFAIDGFVFMGIDTDDDGEWDCRAHGDWRAIRSN